ncbi:hypothetical protein BCV70DRAFT_78575 [Testicularia cyperi]|uniref:Uncharacterized protein n=1 Tax=Testicularia cyperi TaxID=1882483 RepID=A0A317XUZ1_9BASI|nr:hypothetical protein BCV70DRAFT_78575 [Testicularia cyperi]
MLSLISFSAFCISFPSLYFILSFSSLHLYRTMGCFPIDFFSCSLPSLGGEIVSLALGWRKNLEFLHTPGSHRRIGHAAPVRNTLLVHQPSHCIFSGVQSI